MKLTSSLILTAALLSMAIPAGAVTYSIDGGTNGAALGDTNAGWSAAAINHFTAAAGGQNITSVEVLFGGSPVVTNLAGGELFTVALWSDPDSNGNPNDAVLLASAAGLITIFNDNVTFQSTPLSVGLSVGQSFFVGVLYQSYAAGVLPQGVSVAGGTPAEAWLAYNPAGTININNPGSAPVLGNFGATVGAPPAIPMLRATGVPEPGSALLAGVAALGLLHRRRV